MDWVPRLEALCTRASAEIRFDYRGRTEHGIRTRTGRTPLWDDYCYSVSKSYRQFVDVLEGTRSSGAGAEQARKVLNYLGNPQKRLRVVHVTGTNGKGTFCHKVANTLDRAIGYVGVYTSPHLFTACERIVLDHQPISMHLFMGIGRFVLEVCEEAGVTPRYFTTLTLIAILYFAWRRASLVVFEVGIGGERDATNVFDSPLAVVITSIGRDHERLLGSYPEGIMMAKAGIVKPGCNVFVDEPEVPDKLDYLKELIAKRGGVYCRLEKEFVAEYGLSYGVAKAVLTTIDSSHLIERLPKERNVLPPPCRCEVRFWDIDLPRPPAVAFDVAHNVDAMRHSVKLLGESLNVGEVGSAIYVIAHSGKRDLGIFAPIFESWRIRVKDLYYLPSKHPRITKVDEVLKGIERELDGLDETEDDGLMHHHQPLKPVTVSRCLTWQLRTYYEPEGTSGTETRDNTDSSAPTSPGVSQTNGVAGQTGLRPYEMRNLPRALSDKTESWGSSESEDFDFVPEELTSQGICDYPARRTTENRRRLVSEYLWRTRRIWTRHGPDEVIGHVLEQGRQQDAAIIFIGTFFMMAEAFKYCDIPLPIV